MKRRKQEEQRTYPEKQLEYYTKLYHMYDSVYRYLRANVSCEADALDLTQETYTKAWKILDRVENDLRLDLWIKSIARNTLKDYYRKQERDKKHLFLVEDPAGIEEQYKLMSYPSEHDPNENNAILEQIINREEMERFLKALDQLDEKYALPLRLWIFGQFSEKEISEIIDVNYLTVRTRITRGRKLAGKIYLAMKGEEPDEDR